MRYAAQDLNDEVEAVAIRLLRSVVISLSDSIVVPFREPRIYRSDGL